MTWNGCLVVSLILEQIEADIPYKLLIVHLGHGEYNGNGREENEE